MCGFVPGLVAFLRSYHKAQVLAMALDLHILPIGDGGMEAPTEGVETALVQRKNDALLSIQVETRNVSKLLEKLLKSRSTVPEVVDNQSGIVSVA